MKLTISKEHFAEIVGAAAQAASPRATLPVLANVLIRAEQTGENAPVMAAGTNLEIAVQKFTAAAVERAGAISVPARLLSDLVSTFTAGDLTLEEKNGALDITAPGSHVSIRGLAAEEFPALEPHRSSPEGSARLEEGMLKVLVDQTAFSASHEEARPTLQGISCSAAAGALKFASSDGFRLSLASRPVDFTLPPMIIPAVSLVEASKLAHGDTYIRQVPGKLVFSGEDYQLATQLIDGNFPDVAVLVPRSQKTQVIAARALLVTAVERARALDSTRPVTLTVEGEELVITATSEETGETRTIVPCRIEGVAAQRISFNARFFAEALKALRGEEIAIRLNDEKSPALLACPGHDLEYRHIIMPLHMG